MQPTEYRGTSCWPFRSTATKHAVLLSLVFAAMVGMGSAASAVGQPVDGARTAAVAADEDAPVAVPQATDKAMAYYRSGNLLWAINLVWSIAILSCRARPVATLRMVSAPAGGGSSPCDYHLLFNVITRLPIFRAPTEEFVREHAHGLSNQTSANGGSHSTFAVSCIVGSLVLWVLPAASKARGGGGVHRAGADSVHHRRQPRGARLIAPLFNKFEPMHDKASRRDPRARRSRRYRGSRVFEVNKSVIPRR